MGAEHAPALAGEPELHLPRRLRDRPDERAHQFDPEYGLWARSVVISDGTDTAVLTILDGDYYLGRYNNMCTRCGAFSLAEDLGAELRSRRPAS